MALTQDMLKDLLGANTRAGNDAFSQGAQNARQDSENQSQQRLLKLKELLSGQRQTKNLETAQDIVDENSGKGRKVNVGLTPEGGVSLGQSETDPMARLAGQTSKEAKDYLKHAGEVYKPINSQLDASRATLDALNQKNSTSDKLALINEARLAAGQGGSRAISHMVDILSGGKTAAGDFQSKINWLENTPNIPEMQDAQRNAIRESVFNRLPQLEQQHKQAASQLAQQGPLLAPHTDYGTLMRSHTDVADSNLNQLKQMQNAYGSRLNQLGGQPASDPAIADKSQTTVDKLKGLFSGMLGGQKPQQGPGLASSPAQNSTIRVKHKSSGQTGTLPAAEFDPSQYDRL